MHAKLEAQVDLTMLLAIYDMSTGMVTCLYMQLTRRTSTPVSYQWVCLEIHVSLPWRIQTVGTNYASASASASVPVPVPVYVCMRVLASQVAARRLVASARCVRFVSGLPSGPRLYHIHTPTYVTTGVICHEAKRRAGTKPHQ